MSLRPFSTEVVAAFVTTNENRFIRELQEFVRFPSVSAQPKHAGDIRKCAHWLANQLRHAGLDRVKIVPTKGSPVVYAEWLRAPRSPTVLIYGHYDVVPPEPLSEWKSPPFQPVVRGKDLFGRGACDDKGQLFCHVKALEALLKTQRALPVNVKPELGGICKTKPARFICGCRRHVRHALSRPGSPGNRLCVTGQVDCGVRSPRAESRTALRQFRRSDSQSAPSVMLHSRDIARPTRACRNSRVL